MKLLLTIIFLLAIWEHNISGSRDILAGATFRSMNEMKDKVNQIQGKITVGSETFPVTFFINPTTNSLLEQMPLLADLEDYAGLEKIFYPPEKLSTEDAPEGTEPLAGDIMYYAPWGDVAIFYKDFRYAKGLIPLGHIENIGGFLRALEKSESIQIEVQ